MSLPTATMRDIEATERALTTYAPGRADATTSQWITYIKRSAARAQQRGCLGGIARFGTTDEPVS